MEKRKINWPVVVMGAAVVLMIGMYIHACCYGPNSCGAGDEALRQYLEDSFGAENVEVLKIAQSGGTRAVLYRNAQWEDPGKAFIMIFKRHLFGLRWKQTGMDHFTTGTDQLYSTYSWREGRCDVEVYGDNRGGTVRGYAMPGAETVGRDGLEADYILDIYTLNISEPPNRSLALQTVE